MENVQENEKGYENRENGTYGENRGDGTNGAKGEDANPEGKLTKTILKLEEIDKNLFRANYLWKRAARGVYGGQIIGQALVASGKTVPDGLHVNSMHCYFLLSANGLRPIIYQVENMRDGTSFCTRLVKAVQEGKVIFTCMVSYHKHEFSPVTHQYKMPNVPPPESIPSVEDIIWDSLKKGELNEYQQYFTNRLLSQEYYLLELKPIQRLHFGYPVPRNPVEPKLIFWVRMRGSIDKALHNLHSYVAAYISDAYLISTTALMTIPGDKYGLKMLASLNHTLWFHSHVSADQWMLYECECPKIIGSRSLTFGRIWNPDGTLAVSVAQEGLIRLTSYL